MSKIKKQKKFYKTKEFLDLKNEWYKKLYDAGFEDIEWHDFKSGHGQNSDWLVRSSEIMRNMPQHTLFNLTNYYNSCQNFLVHGAFQSKIHHNLWKLHTKGLSYRKIQPILVKNFIPIPEECTHAFPRVGCQFSIRWISTNINIIKQNMFNFNKKDPEGMYYDEQS